VVQNKAAANVAAALEKLNAAKSGAKRVETFELREEEAVYDVVDEASYAQLMSKKRIEAGEGVVECAALSACSTSLDT
jgi:DNA polymerase alpha subunit A